MPDSKQKKPVLKTLKVRDELSEEVQAAADAVGIWGYEVAGQAWTLLKSAYGLVFEKNHLGKLTLAKGSIPDQGGNAPITPEAPFTIPADLLGQIMQEATETGKSMQDITSEAWASYMHIKKGISSNDLNKIFVKDIDSREIMKETERIRSLALEIEKRSATILQVVGEKEAPTISGEDTRVPGQPAPDKEGEDALRELERLREGIDSGTRRTKKAKRLLDEPERADEGADSKVS